MMRLRTVNPVTKRSAENFMNRAVSHGAPTRRVQPDGNQLLK